MSEQFCIFQNLDCVKSGLTEGMMFNERFRMMGGLLSEVVDLVIATANQHPQLFF